MSLKNVFERIFSALKEELPFVVYNGPGDSQLKGIFQITDQLYTSEDYSESGFIFAPFDDSEPAVLMPLEHSETVSVTMDFKKLDDLIHGLTNPRKTASFDVDENEKQAHINRVEKAVEAINEKRFSKVVMSRRESIHIKDTDPIQIFKNLVQRYPSAFVYIWFHPKIGLWLGATPETLVSIRGNQLKTMALAGTQAFNGTTDVMWGEKEKEEQQIVTDFIVSKLEESIGSESSGVENLKVSAVKTIQAGNLLHLQTEISLRLQPQSNYLKPILKALHPTPAVCGFPKAIAKAYILQNEGYSRGYYSGFMGELNFKEVLTRNPNRRNVENNAYNLPKTISNLYVNLRCMEIKDEMVRIYIGGGITKESDPMAEWEETVNKSQIIKSVL